MCVVTSLFISSRATGTGILVNSALTSKKTVVSSGLMVFPLRFSSKSFAFFKKEVFARGILRVTR